MAFDNNVDITGNIVADPEYHAFNSGARKLTFRVGIYAGKDRESDFIDVEAWNDLADNCADRLNKGDRVTIRGAIKYHTWEAKDGGGKRSKHTISADDVALSLRFKKPSGTASSNGNSQPATQQAPTPPPATADLPF